VREGRDRLPWDPPDLDRLGQHALLAGKPLDPELTRAWVEPVRLAGEIAAFQPAYS